jgi:hypothetical protein
MGTRISMGELSPQIAAQELLKRRSIRNSLTEWACHNGFEPAPHHQLFIREIEAFLKSEDEVLLLFAPPGPAKSTYVSVLLASWYLAANPTHKEGSRSGRIRGQEQCVNEISGRRWIVQRPSIAPHSFVMLLA